MIPKYADAIVIGAGVIGASIAYHLTKLGVGDVVILEKEAMAGMGSTSKAPAGIRVQFATPINVRLSLKSMEILETLDEEMKEQVNYAKPGYLFMTAKRENWEILQELMKIQRKEGAEVREVSQAEIKEIAPYAFTDDLIGGTFGPKDGFINPTGLMNAFLGRALQKGARLFLEGEVVGIMTSRKKVKGVKTRHGEIKSEIVVNATGPYAALVAEMAGIKIPVVPIRRHVALTGKVDSLPRLIPMTIDYDTGLVIWRESHAIAIACADPDEKPGFDTSVDRKFFEFIAPKMFKRFPSLEKSGIDSRRSRAGLYEVTPDNHPILGSVDDVRGFYLANGFSGHGVQHAPAVGLLLSELIVNGKAESLDISSLSLKRFKEGKFLSEKTVL